MTENTVMVSHPRMDRRRAFEPRAADEAHGLRWLIDLRAGGIDVVDQHATELLADALAKALPGALRACERVGSRVVERVIVQFRVELRLGERPGELTLIYRSSCPEPTRAELLERVLTCLINYPLEVRA